MKTYYQRIPCKLFNMILIGRKTSLLLKKDRDYQIGDRIILQENEERSNPNDLRILAKITFITENSDLLQNDCCILNICVLECNYEFEPCPFCKNGTSKLTVVNQNEADNLDEDSELYVKNPHYTVCCDYDKGGCGAMCGYRETREMAIETWNMRRWKRSK